MTVARNTMTMAMLLLWTLLPLEAHAFKINPHAEYDKKQNKYVDRELLFPEPLHENLTAQSLLQVNKKYLPLHITSLRTGLVAGVRWNDDPLSMLKNRSFNFVINFEHSCSDSVSSRIDQRWDYLYRTHCGDMQYLHAMASTPEEPYMDTLNKMMMWLEFTYKVSSKRIDTSRRLRSVHELLSETTSRGLFYEQITDNGHKYACSQVKNGKEQCAVVRTLFTFECYRIPIRKLPKCRSNDNVSPTTIMNMALGSGLHILQDSLSDSHVARLDESPDRCSPRKREIGVIKFLNYREQDGSLHGDADLHFCQSAHGPIDLIEVGTKFIEASLKDRAEGSDSWPDIETYLRTTLFAQASNEAPLRYSRKYTKTYLKIETRP